MKMLEHEHVIRYYGQRSMGKVHHLYLEYADGGELFDRIGESCICMCALFKGVSSLATAIRIDPDWGVRPYYQINIRAC